MQSMLHSFPFLSEREGRKIGKINKFAFGGENDL